jgi:hypothetical protein
MPTESYIHNHELWKAWEAVGLSDAGIHELKVLHDYDVDPLEDSEDRVLEIINDECASEFASNAYKIEREAA